jgi:hypothetical protein
VPRLARRGDGMMAVTEILIWHRRHAMVLAGQLPENAADTRLVLIALHELVDNYLSHSPEEGVPPAATVLTIVRDPEIAPAAEDR